MKLVSFTHNNSAKVGILLNNDKIFTLGEFSSMLEVIEKSQNLNLDELFKRANSAKDSELISDYKLLAPIPNPRADVICLGLNYREHIEEAARFNSKKFGIDMPKAVYFSKRVNEALPTFAEIPAHSDICDSLDYEAELAVIISKNCRNATKENAFDYVFGYTILNDISARNVQTAHKQWYLGKSLEGFCPMGSFIATKDEFENPPRLNIRSFVNGELRQNSNTSFMIYGIDDVICQLSQAFELKAGDIIAMGTPSGVGMGFNPPKFLKSGDEVVCEIDGLGRLVNRVK